MSDCDTVLTERELRTTRKSVISAPAWKPPPSPASPMALGADHAVRRTFEPGAQRNQLGLLTAILQSRYNYTSTCSRGKQETGLEHREYCKSSCVFEDAPRYYLRGQVNITCEQCSQKTSISCKVERALTRSRPLFPLSTNDLTADGGHVESNENS